MAAATNFSGLLVTSAKIAPSVLKTTCVPLRLPFLTPQQIATGTAPMSENPPEKSEMSELSFASEMMRERIAPAGTAQFVETRIRAAARALHWKFSRAKDVWYTDPRVSLKPRELRKIEEVAGVQYGRAEVREIDLLIGRADALLLGQDPDFHSPFVAALRALLGAVDRTGTGNRDAD